MEIDYNLKKNSGIYLGASKNLVYKFYFNQKKSRDDKLINEYNGNHWYLSRIKNNEIKNLKIIKKKTNIDLIRIPYFYGKKLKFWKNILNKENEILLVLNHYKNIWPKNKKLVPYHGDLTLSNIIFQKKNVRFIDWENFEKKKLWGLDICYFLLSLILLPAICNKDNNISEDIKKNFIMFWQFFFKNNNSEYLNDPISYLQTKTSLSQDSFLNIIPKRLKKNIYQILDEASK